MPMLLKELRQFSEDLVKSDPFRTWRQRDDQLHYRSLYVKHDPQLSSLTAMFKEKIERVIEHYERVRQGLHYIPSGEYKNSLSMLEEKIRRLSEKLRDTDLEIRGRSLDVVKRNPIGTEYFIDFTDGNDSADGLSPATAWNTLLQYTSVTVRSPGDIAWIRAGRTEIMSADVVCDEDGLNDYIYIIGASAGSSSGIDSRDPWGDDLDDLPVVDFNASSLQFNFVTDDYWWLERLHVKNSTDPNLGGVMFDVSRGPVLKRCRFTDRNYSVSPMVCFNSSAWAEVDDCEFYDNRYAGMMAINTSVNVRGSRFNAGVIGTLFGIYIGSGGFVNAENCDFGQTTPHGNADVYFRMDPAAGFFRNCRLNKLGNQTNSMNGCLHFDNCQIADAPQLNNGNRNYLRDAVPDTTVPPGELGESIKMSPRTNLVGLRRATLSGGRFVGTDHPIKVWLPAGTHVVSMKLRAADAWASYPTAEELYITARYFDDLTPGSFRVGTIRSSAVLVDAVNWVDFNLNIETGKDGWVFLDVVLGKYEASKSIYIFPKVYIS